MLQQLQFQIPIFEIGLVISHVAKITGKCILTWEYIGLAAAPVKKELLQAKSGPSYLLDAVA